MTITSKEVASLIALQFAMKKYFPSVDRFYDAVESAEKTTTDFLHNMQKRIIEGKSSKEKGEYEGMAS